MATAVLKAFIKEALTKGQSREEIARVLGEAGWPEDQIRVGLAQFADTDFPVPVPMPARDGSAREAFLYIVFFSLLGGISANLVTLSFAFIDVLVPDPLDRPRVSGAGSLRWPVSFLLVSFPIFLWIGAQLGSKRRRDPERQTSRVRSWLTYITLIFAALFLIGDLVAIVFSFLEGDLSARFLAKAGVVAALSGGILFYFTRDAERTNSSAGWASRALVVVFTIITILLVIWAFTLTRGPGNARKAEFDARRLDDVKTIAQQADCYRTYFGSTPSSLAEMETKLRARAADEGVRSGCTGRIPTDPRTSEPYTYRQIDNRRYELCAAFEAGFTRDADGNKRERFLLAPIGLTDDERRVITLPDTQGEACFTIRALGETDQAIEAMPTEN